MPDNDWSEQELDAAVDGYLTLLRDENAGKLTNKAALNRALREGALRARSRGSVEFRMANISAVLRDHGLPYVQGYQPRANVGAAVAAMILDALRRNGGMPGVGERQPSAIERILRRYHAEQIVFKSAYKKHRYAISNCEAEGVTVERVDANEPVRVTFAQAERLIQQVKAIGSVDFVSLNNTSAIRTTVLQAEELGLSNSQKRVVYLPDTAARLSNFLEALDNLRMSHALYKPAMLLCVVEGIERGELKKNEVTFDWVAPRFVEKLHSFGAEAGERSAAEPFYHLTGDLIWVHAANDLNDLMTDGSDGPAAAREKVRYAFLKDTYWTLLQDADSRNAVRQKLNAMLAASDGPSGGSSDSPGSGSGSGTPAPGSPNGGDTPGEAGNGSGAESAPDDDEGRLREKTRRLRKRGVVDTPAGQQKPEKGQFVRETYKRDPKVRAWVLENAKGICELCGNPAPFLDVDGFPFLEVHHVKPLAEDGPDTINNAVALCPNCHRRCHEGEDRDIACDRLYSQTMRLVLCR